jgi:hypothetical protein
MRKINHRLHKFKVGCIACCIQLSGISAFSQVENIASIDKAIIKPTDKIALYALPKTVLVVQSYITRDEVIAGPYCQYAKELLGMDVAMQNSVSWKIDSIKIVPSQIIDASQIYVVKFGKTVDYSRLKQLSADNMIIFPLENFSNLNQSDTISLSHQPGNSRSTNFRLFISLPNTTITSDTTYKIVRKDSLLIRVPVVKQKSETKSEYEKAKDAVNFIFHLRQRKVELILSEDDPLPANEKSLQLAISEINNLEDEYFKLFVGHTQSKSVVYTTCYIPNAKIKDQKAELFRFSSLKGISDSNDLGAYPVFITIEDENYLSTLKDYQTALSSFQPNYIYYRIPDFASVTVTSKDKILGKAQVPIFQYGAMIPFFMPIK